MSQTFEFAEERIVLEEPMEAMREAQRRLERLEAPIRAAVPDSSPSSLVTALIAMRGLDIMSAATTVAEVGDLSRFRTPRELMAWNGAIGGRDRRQGQAWSDHQDRQSAAATHAGRVCLELPVSSAVEPRQTGQGEAVPQAVREIAWKAQSRLNQGYRALLRRGKLKNVTITAVAREFVGFIWAVAQAVRATAAATNTKTPAVTS
jgi:hypothetical protein